MQKLLLVFILVFLAFGQKPQLFINYGVDQQGIQLFKFFHDVNDGFYVDIGSYDSIFASNTLNLQTMGWSGINVDASPDRLPRFTYSRPWQPSLNFAIGDQDEILTLYELAQDSSSTISPKVKQLVKGYKPVVKQTKVHSISMKQLCERFFYRRPIFLNLDIQGVGTKALESNDWNNSLCVPEIIFSQINQQAIISGLPLAQKVLQQKGYKKWRTNVGLNQIYVHGSIFDKYSKNYDQGTKLMQGKSVQNIGIIGMNLASRIGVNTILAVHHEPKTDNIFYHFTKPKQIVDISSINKFSNQISDRENRPILILHFNPQNNYLLIKDANYQTSMLSVSPQVQFFVITIDKKNTKLNVFILDHHFKTLQKPKIIKSEVNINQSSSNLHGHQQFTLQKIVNNKTNITVNQKMFLSIQNQLKQLNQILGNMAKDDVKRIDQIMKTVAINHKYNKNQMQILTNKIENINVLNNQLPLGSFGESIKKATQPTKQKIITTLRLIIALTLTIFFSFLIINMIICITYSQLSNRSGQKTRQNQFQELGQITTTDHIKHSNMDQ